MTSTNFIYFLQGFMELTDTEEITAEQLKMIKGHLQLAFRDDIDKRMGDINHQIKLSKAHEGDNAPLGDSIFSGYKPGQRC